MQKQSITGKSQWTILKTLNWTTSYFKTNQIENSKLSAEILLANTLNIERIDLYLKYDQPLSNHELKKFKTLIKRRINREPVAYITGKKEFWSMPLKVTMDVLIPRPETECLVEAALSLLSEKSTSVPNHILELGTGSGAVTLALASMRPNDFFFSSDRSIKALELARKNAAAHKLDKAVVFVAGKWFRPFNDILFPFDMIISNPPYILTEDIKRLQPEIYKYEPLIALDGGKDGLFHIKQIINSAHSYLKEEGRLLLEIGSAQKDGVQKIIDQCRHYDEILFTKDYSGYYRVVQMRKSK